MDKASLVASLRIRMFGDRGTDIQAAWDYADSIICTLEDRAPIWTAVHVLMNTIANAVEALPEHIEFLPEPPAVIRISPEDNPATGAPEQVMLALDRAALDEIIDARITNWYENDLDLQEKINSAINDYDFEETVRDVIRHNITFSVEMD